MGSQHHQGELFGMSVTWDRDLNDAERQQVRQALRQPNHGVVQRDGAIALLDVLPLARKPAFGWGYDEGDPSPVRHLAECGDVTCGTNRIHQPEVRPRFQDFCLRRFAIAVDVEKAFPPMEPLVYASFGAGRLLFDFLFLEELLREGRKLERVCVIDKYYDKCLDERRVDPYQECQLALQQFAAWFEEVDVVAFGTGEEYTKACKSEPNLLAHILMHCDAADDTHLNDSDSDSETDSEEEPDSQNHWGVDAGAAAKRERGCKAAAKKAKAEAKAKSEAEALQKQARGAVKKDMPAKDRKAALFETMGMVPSVPTGLEPLKVLREGGMFFQLQNVGSHEKKKCSELNRASATTAVTDCWQKRKPDKESSTAGQDLFGNRMQMFRVVEKGMNAESEDQRAKRLLVQQQKLREADGQVYRVVHSPFVVVRDTPSVHGKILSGKRFGEHVLVEKIHDNGLWVKLNNKHESFKTLDGFSGEAWMLIDGAQVGLGTLLELVS